MDGHDFRGELYRQSNLTDFHPVSTDLYVEVTPDIAPLMPHLARIGF